MWCGIDSSTQSLKVMLVDSSRLIHHEVSINFDAQLSSVYPQGSITRGTYGLPAELERAALQADGAAASLIVTSPTLLFVHALDLAFERLKEQGAPLHSVVGISGSGQQHGSVYWNTGAANTLTHLDPQQPLHTQLHTAFAIPSQTAQAATITATTFTSSPPPASFLPPPWLTSLPLPSCV